MHAIALLQPPLSNYKVGTVIILSYIWGNWGTGIFPRILPNSHSNSARQTPKPLVFLDLSATVLPEPAWSMVLAGPHAVNVNFQSLHPTCLAMLCFHPHVRITPCLEFSASAPTLEGPCVPNVPTSLYLKTHSGEPELIWSPSRNKKGTPEIKACIIKPVSTRALTFTSHTFRLHMELNLIKSFHS